MPALRAALYARCSTADQTVHLQIDGLRRLAEQRGWSITAEYVDQGVSGSKDRRPALDKLMGDVHRGKVDIVAVWRFDRFARSVRHLVLALDEFRAKGVDFVSVHDGIDTSTPAGRFSFTIIAAVAELERELIRERTRAGLASARQRGARLGRPPVTFDLDLAARLRSEGRSIRWIARKMGLKVATLHRALGAVPKTAVFATVDPCDRPFPEGQKSRHSVIRDRAAFGDDSGTAAAAPAEP